MDYNSAAPFEEKNYTWNYFPFVERPVTVNYLSMAKNSNCSGECRTVSSSFFRSTLLPHLLFAVNPMEKSLKALRIETWFQWHSGKSGICLLSSEKGLSQSATGDLMRQIIEHSLIQVTTYGMAQKISKLPVSWLICSGTGWPKLRER